MLSVMFIMLNLFTMVISKASELLHNDARQSTMEHIGAYKTAWATLDPNGSGTIRRTQLVPLLWAIPEPLGCGVSAHAAETGESDLERRTEKMRAYAKVILAQPESAAGCNFNEALIALITLHLAVPDDGSPYMDRVSAWTAPMYMPPAHDFMHAIVVLNGGLRRMVERRRKLRKGGSEDTALDHFTDYVHETAAQAGELMNEFKEEMREDFHQIKRRASTM